LVVHGHPILVDFDDPTLGGCAGPVFVSIETAAGLETNIDLFQGLHFEMGDPDPGRPDLSRLPHRESQTANDESVREWSGGDVDVETPLELGGRDPIPKPVPLTVGLKEQLSLARLVDDCHLSNTSSPPPVEFDPEGDRPRLASIHRHFVALYPNRVSPIETNQAQAPVDVQARPRVRQHQVMVWDWKRLERQSGMLILGSA